MYIRNKDNLTASTVLNTGETGDVLGVLFDCISIKFLNSKIFIKFSIKFFDQISETDFGANSFYVLLNNQQKQLLLSENLIQSGVVESRFFCPIVIIFINLLTRLMAVR